MKKNSKNFWRETGKATANVGLGVADIGLSVLGATNVIQTDDYKGASANSFGAVTDITGSAAKAAAPIIANAIAPGSGAIVSGVQAIGGSFNPQNISGDPTVIRASRGLESAGAAASPFLAGIGGGGGGAPEGTTSGMSSSGAVSRAPASPVVARYGAMIRYKMGGEPNAEVEHNEYITSNTPPEVYEGGGMELASNNPYGTPTYQTDGRSHDDGGIVTELAPGTIINGKTKNPETGNTFSKDMSILTSREDKYTKMLTKATDPRTRESIKESLKLMADKKERLNALQQEIIASKEKAAIEKDFFELGGMVSYKDGGIHINPKNKGKFTAAAKRAGMGVQEYARHVLANKENYSSTLVKRANFARNASKWKHEDGGMIYENGGKLPQPILKARLEAHMSPEKAQEYLNNYPNGGQIPNRFYPTSDEYGVYEQGGFLPLHLANRFYPDTSVGGMMKFQDGGTKYMTTKQWADYNKSMGYVPTPDQNLVEGRYWTFYNPKEYAPAKGGFVRVSDVGKPSFDYTKDPTYKPMIQYSGPSTAPIQTSAQSPMVDYGAVNNTPEALYKFRESMNRYREKRGLPITEYKEYGGMMPLDKFKKGGKKEKPEFMPSRDIALSTFQNYSSNPNKSIVNDIQGIPATMSYQPTPGFISDIEGSPLYKKTADPIQTPEIINQSSRTTDLMGPNNTMTEVPEWNMMLPKPDQDPSNFGNTLKNYAPNIIGSLAENVGNLWTMAEKGPERVSYERATANYLDPTASMREADRQARIAAYDIASRGAGRPEYIASRASMAAKAADLKDKYVREYQNLNTGIANQTNQYNVGLSKAERDAQAANDAAYRNMRRTAMSSIGTNIAGTTKDISQANRDKEMVSMLPEIYNSPEFKEFYKKYKEKRLGK